MSEQGRRCMFVGGPWDGEVREVNMEPGPNLEIHAPLQNGKLVVYRLRPGNVFAPTSLSLEQVIERLVELYEPNHPLELGVKFTGHKLYIERSGDDVPDKNAAAACTKFLQDKLKAPF